MSKLNVDGIQIKIVSGAHCTKDGFGSIITPPFRTLEGEVSKDELIHLLEREWISGLRCDDCGRHDYCKYRTKAEKVGHSRELIEDMTFRNKCGVIKSIIENYVDQVFPELLKMDKSDLQYFLRGSYYLIQYYWYNEVAIGSIQSRPPLKSSHPLEITDLLSQRNQLDLAAKFFNRVKGYKIKQGVFLVEGDSEDEFITNIQIFDLSIGEFVVRSYDGKGNKRTEKIKLLLDKYREMGFEIFIEGDLDGKDPKESHPFQDQIKKGLIEMDHSFVFKHEFESSIPRKILHKILEKLGYDIPYEVFEPATSDMQKSVITQLKENLGINIESRKVEIARELAYLINSQDDPLIGLVGGSELGEFLMFLFNIPHKLNPTLHDEVTPPKDVKSFTFESKPQDEKGIRKLLTNLKTIVKHFFKTH